MGQTGAMSSGGAKGGDSGSSLAAGASAISSAFSSIGSAYAQSRAISAQGDYQKAVADTNANLANIEGEQAIQAGDFAASRKSVETRNAVSTELARGGASGISVGSGSSALTRIGTDLAGKIDLLTIKNNAARQAWGYKTQALNDTFSGQISKMTAASRSQQTLLNGGLEAVRGPLSIYANSQLLQRRYGGGNSDVPYPDSGSGSSVPRDMV